MTSTLVGCPAWRILLPDCGLAVFADTRSRSAPRTQYMVSRSSVPSGRDSIDAHLVEVPLDLDHASARPARRHAVRQVDDAAAAAAADNRNALVGRVLDRQRRARAAAGCREAPPGERRLQSPSHRLKVVAGRHLQIGHLDFVGRGKFARHALELEGCLGLAFLERVVDRLAARLAAVRCAISSVIARDTAR